MFAERIRWSLNLNVIAQRRAALRKAGVPILDLTESNPTQCGIQYPDRLLAPLTDSRSLIYEPDPRGLLSAREAVASIYEKKGAPTDPEKILLTSSTSEAYHFLFRLLANPGDSVLVPKPSYPLFEHLAKLSDVELVQYPLRYTGPVREGPSWRIDFRQLKPLITRRTRAVVLVSPNNPTGSCVSPEELTGLSLLCQAHDLALILDEVFAEYLHAGLPTTGLAKVGSTFLSVSLGGVSKFFGLPQMKLAWMVMAGPAGRLELAMERLELIADTFLSVNTPAQVALTRWLPEAAFIQTQIRKRITANRQALLTRLPEQGPVECLRSEGGWTAVLRVPSIRDEEAWVVGLLERGRVLLYPGYFFDFEEPGILVVSLLPPTEIFREAIGRILKQVSMG